jgi:hypothetical protein
MDDLMVQQITAVSKKLEELSGSIISRADEDRTTAKQIYDLIQAEIAKVQAEFTLALTTWEAAYEVAIKEPDPKVRTDLLKAIGRRPYKKPIVDYIEQLNKSLEMSIRSSDSVVNLLATLAKASTVKNNIKEVNIDNRAMILEEIIAEEEARKRQKVESTK